MIDSSVLSGRCLRLAQWQRKFLRNASLMCEGLFECAEHRSWLPTKTTCRSRFWLSGRYPGHSAISWQIAFPPPKAPPPYDQFMRRFLFIHTASSLFSYAHRTLPLMLPIAPQSCVKRSLIYTQYKACQAPSPSPDNGPCSRRCFFIAWPSTKFYLYAERMVQQFFC